LQFPNHPQFHSTIETPHAQSSYNKLESYHTVQSLQVRTNVFFGLQTTDSCFLPDVASGNPSYCEIRSRAIAYPWWKERIGNRQPVRRFMLWARHVCAPSVVSRLRLPIRHACIMKLTVNYDIAQLRASSAGEGGPTLRSNEIVIPKLHNAEDIRFERANLHYNLPCPILHITRRCRVKSESSRIKYATSTGRARIHECESKGGTTSKVIYIFGQVVLSRRIDRA
jgi:hypothetical protein